MCKRLTVVIGMDDMYRKIGIIMARDILPIKASLPKCALMGNERVKGCVTNNLKKKKNS